MRKTRLLKHFLLLFALIVGSTSVWAEDDVYRTALFGASYNPNNSNYTSSFNATNGDFVVTVTNFNNNNNGWTNNAGNGQIKCGRKNTTSVASIATNAAIDKAITKVVVTIDAITASNVNSIKLYSSSDGSTWNENGSFTKATGAQAVSLTTPTANLYYKVVFDCAAGNSNGLVTVSKVEYYSNVGSTPAVILSASSLDFGNVNINETKELTFTVTPANLTSNLTIACDNGKYEVTPTSIASTVSAETTITVTAKPTATTDEMDGTITISGGGLTANKTVTLTTNVVDPNAPGSSADNPYTVAEARAAIDAGTGTQGVYATGIVSAIPTAYNSQYNNITFNFVDAEGDTEFLQAYRCGGDEAEDVAVGDIVVVYGNLIKYNNTTYEFAQGCQLVSLTHPTVTTPVINADDVEIEYDATSGEIAYTISHSVESKSLTAVTSANWISNISVSNDKVTFTTTANEDDADRTATFTLSYPGAADKTVTVTQKHYVPDYATLPFAFDGGKADVATTAGLTQDGLGTDYNNSPKLKFDGTGDYLILKFNEAPGVLTFNIKGNSFSGGTFKVQTSVDGVTYTDLKAYTELGTTQSEEFNNLNENVRYIKWIYTLKDEGNVALGNITLAKYVEPSTISQIEANNVEIAYYANSGEIPVTIVNPVEGASFGAGTFDTPWITNVKAVKIDATHYKVTFTPRVNTGDERSATITINYNGVTKDVTVTQTAAPVVSGSEINAVDEITLEADATSGEITYTITNPVAGVRLTAEVSQDVDWISGIEVTDEKVTFTVTPNVYAMKRMTVMYLHYGSTVNKNVTINQKAYIQPGEEVANLPFEFDGGVNDIAPTDGLSQDGLGKDYNTSPYLKFDSTDDWLLLQFNERPGTLTFDIKGNTFSGGTFKVQTSADGATFTDLETYTELGDVQNEEFNNLASDVRFIKWIYTEKVNGNVALGNISLDQYDPTPSITVNPNVVNATAAETDGTLIVKYKNIVMTAGVGVQFCNANGGNATYDWIDAEINDENNVDYLIEANDGEARTAYLKVYGVDAGSNNVYSNIVTITQAEYAAPSTEGYYVKVTSTDEIADGQYLIVYEDGSLAFDGSLETLDAGKNTISVTINDNWIAMTDDTEAAEFTIDASAGTIKSASGFYIGQTTDANGLASSTSTAYINTLSFDDDGNAVILSSGGAYLRYNATSGQERFRYFRSTTYTAQKAIQLYKLVVPNTVAASVSQYKYATFSSKFALDFTNVTDVEARIVTGADGKTILTDKVTGTVAAGTGLVLYSETEVENVEIPVVEEGDDYSETNKLIAVTRNGTTVGVPTAGTNYVLAVQDGKAVFAYIANVEATLSKGQAYLHLDGTPAAPYLSFEGGETTGIGNVNRETITNNQYYTLDGRRVENPSNGVYIVNGKKVVIK